MLDSGIENLKNILKQHSIKLTHTRIIILKYLLENRYHPSVKEIYKDLSKKYPSLSKTTIYNTLKTFIKKNIIIELPLNNEEMLYDINLTPHAHFRCLKCKKIYDISIDKNYFANFENKLNGNKVYNTLIIIQGLCKNCQKKLRK